MNIAYVCYDPYFIHYHQTDSLARTKWETVCTAYSTQQAGSNTLHYHNLISTHTAYKSNVIDNYLAAISMYLFISNKKGHANRTPPRP